MARHPAHEQGYRDFYNGILENPFARIFKGKYVTDSIASREYQAGQNNAYYENLTKIKEQENADRKLGS